jgi:AraC-like DNA-binding protein/ligand-binding sensor protein
MAKALAEKISRSQMMHDYEHAFSESTRMPLSFRPVENWNLVQRGKKYANSFCEMLAESGATCAMCLEAQDRVKHPHKPGTQTTVCLAGLCESAVPVTVGNKILGYLHTGQIALKRPTKAQFKRISRQLLDWGVKTDFSKLEDAYFHTTVLSKRQYEAMIRLIEVFSQHLSIAAEQMAVRDEHSVSPAIARAKKYIQERAEERISLGDVAKVVNASTFYFCKMFKRATGLTFTEYLSLVRITKAKNLLVNPNLRISEVAYQVGFESLTHFNRVFRKLVGSSPTAYRNSLPKTV